MKLKRRIALVVAILMFASVLSTFAFPALEQSLEDYSAKLVEAQQLLFELGVPQDVISLMTDAQIINILENIDLEVAIPEFSSFSIVDFAYNEAGDLYKLSEIVITLYETTVYLFDSSGTIIEHFSCDSRSGIAPLSIPTSDLTLRLTGFRSGTHNGVPRYQLFPSFIWHRPVKVTGDAFAFSVFHGWEVIAGENVNLRLWNRNWQGTLLHYVDLAPDVTQSSGFGFRVPSNVGNFQVLMEGHAFFFARRWADEQSTQRALTMNYAHDRRTFFSRITISIGFGVISISSPTGHRFDTRSANLTF